MLKSGPNGAGSHRETQNTHEVELDIIDLFQITFIQHSKFSVEHLFPSLQEYQTWFYGSRPVLYIAELVLTILDAAQKRYRKDTIRLTEQNAMLYTLSCSVCVAITSQVSYDSEKRLCSRLYYFSSLQICRRSSQSA